MNFKRELQTLAWAGCLGVALACQSQTQDSGVEDKMTRMGALIQQKQGHIAFYGKVVDQ